VFVHRPPDGGDHVREYQNETGKGKAGTRAGKYKP
jgi:hypothetical protein